MEILGPRDAAVDLIAIAWAGPPFLEIASAFAGASDEQLQSWFQENEAGFLDRSFLWKFARIMRVLREYDMCPADLSRVLAKLPIRRIRLHDVWAGIRLLVMTQESSKKEARLASEWDIFPLQEAIDAMVHKWRVQNPRPKPTSWTTGVFGGMVVGRNVQALQAYLQKYVATHRALPTGLHVVPVRQGSDLKVDFDKLMPGVDG